MSDSKITGTIVKEYLSKYPAISSRQLAKILIKEIPTLFTNEEHARAIVRYYRGACGEYNRKNMDPDKYTPKIVLPSPVEENYEPYILPEDSYPILVGADAHFPYHDQDAIEMFFDYGEKKKVKTILLLGDWFDFYQLSHWMKDPRCRNVDSELAIFKKLMKDIRSAFPRAKIVFKYGNHEERWDNYIMTHAPALFHVPETHLSKQLGLEELNIDIVDNKRIIKMGHLYGIHGHEYVFSISNPVNPARGLYLRAKKSAICAHFHQTSEHTESAISGDINTTWTIGALCGMHPNYMPLNKWNLGFAKIDMERKSFTVSNKRIIENRIV